jgi:hypothetical protein
MRESPRSTEGFPRGREYFPEEHAAINTLLIYNIFFIEFTKVIISWIIDALNDYLYRENR